MDLGQIFTTSNTLGTWAQALPLLSAGSAGLSALALLFGVAQVARGSLPQGFPRDPEAAKPKYILAFRQLVHDVVVNIEIPQTGKDQAAALLSDYAFRKGTESSRKSKIDFAAVDASESVMLPNKNSWGEIPLGASQVHVRRIVFWIGLAGWFLLTLPLAQTHAITSFAFNISFMIGLLIVTTTVRSVSLHKIVISFLSGGFTLGILLAVVLGVSPELNANPVLKPFLLGSLQTLFALAPVAFFVWQGRRFSSLAMGATDFLLLGAAAGAGFAFMPEAFSHQANPTYNHFFVLLPSSEIINGRLTIGGSALAALSAGTLGLAYMLKKRRTVALVLAPIGLIIAALDQIAMLLVELPNMPSWAVSTFNFCSGNGYVALVFFVLCLAACICVDLFVQARSLPKAREFSFLARKDKRETLDAFWDSLLDLRSVSYAYYRYKIGKNVGDDLCVSVALRTRRLINRVRAIDLPTMTGMNAFDGSATATVVRTVEGTLQIGNTGNNANEALRASQDPLGTLIDLPQRYRIIEQVGAGGMGVIYKGKHLGTGAEIAIKGMHPQYSASPAHARRFEQEARMASNLKHPNIVTVHDFGVTERSVAYLVMEWLDGQDMAKVLSKCGRFDLQQFLRCFSQAADALAFAHRSGIVHRDIKPSNLIIGAGDARSGLLKVVDFGTAKLLNAEGSEALTQAGEVLGSPLYMSPEQCQGLTIDHRTDIYSLACVMYEVLIGQPPFMSSNPAELFFMHSNDMPPRPTTVYPKLPMPQYLEPFLFRGLQKDPDKRFASMEEVSKELERIRQFSAANVQA